MRSLRTAQALYDAVVARYSSPATAALGRLLLPYLFLELSAFATVEDLVSHLRTTVPAEFLDRNQPPMFITLYFIVTRLPNSLRSVRDQFLSLDPTSLIVDLLEQHLLATETSAVAVGAARGTPRPPFFEGCSPSPLAPSYASAAAAYVSVSEDIGAASASAKRRSSKGKGGRGGGGGRSSGGGGSGSGGGGSSGGSGGGGGGGGGGTGGGSGGSGGGGGGSGGSGGCGGGGTGGGRTGPRHGGPGGGQRQQQQRWSETQSPQPLCDWLFQRGTSGGSDSWPYHHSFSHLDVAWRAEFGDDVELPRWADLLRSGVAIFDLDYDAILAAMYAWSISAKGDCYLCVPPDPRIEAAALIASESALPGSAPAEALHTFTLDSGVSHWLFCESTTLIPLPAPVPFRLADPSRGPVVARSSTVLPCPAVPSGSLSGLHLPSFSMNLVSTAALQDAMATTTTPGGQRVSICTCTRTGRHLATFTRRPGSSLYTLATEPPRVAASAQVSASGPLAPPCSCRLLSYQTLLWHHRLGNPSLPRLRGMHSRLLVSGLPRSLPPLPPSPAPPCLPCVEGRQRRSSLLLVSPDDCSPAASPHGRRLGQDLLVLRLHSNRGGEFSSNLLRDFCRGEGILQSFTLPNSPQQNGIVERRIGLVMEVARTSMNHAAAPHFLWPFAVWEVGNASVFRVWGSRAFVRDTFANKLSARAIPCVFLGFVPDVPGWQFCHPTSRRVLPSQDVTFASRFPSTVSFPTALPLPRPRRSSLLPVHLREVGNASVFRVWGSRAFVRDTFANKLSARAIPCSVPFYRLFPYRSAPPPPPPLFLAPGPPPVDPLPPEGPAPSGVSQVDTLPGTVPVEVAVGSGAAPDTSSGGASSGGAGSKGAGSGAAEPGGEEPEGVEPVGAESECAESGGAEPRGAAFSGGPAGTSPRQSPQQLREWLVRRARLPSGAPGAGGAGVTAEASGIGGPASAGPGGARTKGARFAGIGGVGGAVVGDPTELGAAGAGDSCAGGAGTGGAGAGGAGVGGSGAGGAGAEGAGAVDPGAGGAGGTVRPRLYFVPLLQQPASPLPAPSPYTEQTGRLIERRESASRPVSLVRTALRVPRSRPPRVPVTHAMALRPSSVPLRVPLPPPPESSLPEIPNLESDHARAASPTVARLLATVVTDPCFELEYVDDLVFATADTEALTLVKSELQKRHTYTDLGEPRINLGLQITRDRARCTITLTQSHMVHHVLQCFGFQFSSSQPTPLSTGHSLSVQPSDESVEPSGPYPELVGCLMYMMTCTRPDLAYPLSLLARYVALGGHRKVHWDAANRVLRSLCSTSGMGLVLGGRDPVVLPSHADASWVDGSATQRSSQGYTFSLGSGTVSLQSTHSSSVLSSSCEAEIYARAMAAQELRWLTYLLTNLGEQPRSPPVLYVDNKAMIALCQEHRLEHRTKHIALRFFLAREL
ncbi:unnamed protein product [Closterium sp. NIES-54]